MLQRRSFWKRCNFHRISFSNSLKLRWFIVNLSEFRWPIDFSFKLKSNQIIWIVLHVLVIGMYLLRLSCF